MEKNKVNVIKVNVTRNKYSGRYYATCYGGMCTLFSFKKCDCLENGWEFYDNFTKLNRLVCCSSPEFPLESFVSLAKATSYIMFYNRALPEIELTVRAKKLLKIN